ncbi:MAG: ABC transporter ATP-binding protein [Candidatus Diapherotrites archaeon]|nr:ABC transporter ATP-binding protein [Candidatus Diapherotrites archaeon]
MLALQSENVCKSFAHGKKIIAALENVSLEIREGEIVGLLGPNGAGKTTFISAICGLLELDSGSIAVFGKDVSRERSQVINEINLVTGFAGLLNGLSVEDLLRYYAMLYSIPDKKQRIEDALIQTGLSEKRGQIANTLSSGYRQRFYISKALLTHPRLLLMDEPTVGLDVESARQIRVLVQKQKKQGTTILLTTHYMHEAEQLCDRIAIINSGRIEAFGTVRELKKMADRPSGSLEEVFLALTKSRWEGDFVEARS